MTYSEVKITFLENLSVGTVLRILLENENPLINDILWTETWFQIRTGPFQTPVGSESPTNPGPPGSLSGYCYYKSFILDYNQLGEYEVNRVGNIVTIKCYNLGWNFVSGTVTMGLDGEALDSCLFEFTNFGDEIYKLNTVTFSQATTPCTKAKVIVSTEGLSTKILSPIIVNGNEANPFEFEWFRGQTVNFKSENAEGVQLSFPITVPDVLNKDNFQLNITNTPAGSTIVANNVNSNGLQLQYSLDNTTWQASNTYSGILEGDYTLYIKDQLGCSISIPFTVNEFGVNEPYFYLSKANSIRFAQRGNFAYKNDDNTLSCEAPVKLPYKEILQFVTNDTITTQFKSNYNSHTIKVTDNLGNEQDYVAVKKTSNIGNKEKRDAIKYNLGNNKTGIYFNNGNIYDYVSGSVTGNYFLNGQLPLWAVIGNYIIISATWFKIEDIIFDDSKNADVLVISNLYTGPQANVIVGTIFNIFNYDVFEVTIDFGFFENKKLTVSIDANDNFFEDLAFASEAILVKDTHPDTKEIRYKNIDNTDIVYATGIEHLIRVQINKVSGYLDENSDINKTDSSVILLNADIYEGDEFLFEPVTKQMMRKLVIALAHKLVWIDGTGYVMNGNPEVEGPLDETNLYVVKAKMLKNGNPYSTRPNGSPEGLYNGESLELPGFLDFDGGFIQI